MRIHTNQICETVILVAGTPFAGMLTSTMRPPGFVLKKFINMYQCKYTGKTTTAQGFYYSNYHVYELVCSSIYIVKWKAVEKLQDMFSQLVGIIYEILLTRKSHTIIFDHWPTDNRLM